MSGILTTIGRYYHTIRYLNAEQIAYRLYYPLKRIWYRSPRRVKRPGVLVPGIGIPVCFQHKGIYTPQGRTFHLLNRTVSFGDKIDWRFQAFGLLWQFHLYYFDWLKDESISLSERLNSILEFIENDKDSVALNSSYTISIRLRNWIIFCIEHQVSDDMIISFMYREADRLFHFPEYEIGGNHLLENSITLVWAGLYFKEHRFLKQGEKLLSRELERQILPDGAHYENSLGYHTFIQKNIFDLLLFCRHFSYKEELFYKIKSKFLQCLSYVKYIRGEFDFLPHFADSNPEMDFWTEEMSSLAQILYLNDGDVGVSIVGPLVIRLFDQRESRLFFFRGIVPAAEQPGHSHADAFTFCMIVRGEPFIVDPGVSTYEQGATRVLQRSTRYHNTIAVGGGNSADVWSSFRMGRRASVVTLDESDFHIDCQHDGFFNKYGLLHRRRVEVSPSGVVIEDELKGAKAIPEDTAAYVHFHPDVQVKLTEEGVYVPSLNITLLVEGGILALQQYDYCAGFYKVVPSQKLEIKIISNRIKLIIRFADG